MLRLPCGEQIERGATKDPRLGTLRALAKALDVSLSDLVGPEE